MKFCVRGAPLPVGCGADGARGGSNRSVEKSTPWPAERENDRPRSASARLVAPFGLAAALSAPSRIFCVFLAHRWATAVSLWSACIWSLLLEKWWKRVDDYRAYVPTVTVG